MKTKTLRCGALFEFVKTMLDNSKLQNNVHDFGHIKRVYGAGIVIGEAENADFEILEPSLLLHDIIRPNSKAGEKDHASASAALARKILPDFSYNSDEIELIAHAIAAHEANPKCAPKTLEAKVVYDADKADWLGFSGCARAMLIFSGCDATAEKAAEEYLKKIMFFLNRAPFYTNSAVRLADERLTISMNFCKELLGKEKFGAMLKK